MHTRGDLSTFSGLLSTRAMNVRRRWKVALSERFAGKIRVCIPSPIYPQSMWITPQLVDNFAAEMRIASVDEQCTLRGLLAVRNTYARIC